MANEYCGVVIDNLNISQEEKSIVRDYLDSNKELNLPFELQGVLNKAVNDHHAVISIKKMLDEYTVNETPNFIKRIVSKWKTMRIDSSDKIYSKLNLLAKEREKKTSSLLKYFLTNVDEIEGINNLEILKAFKTGSKITEAPIAVASRSGLGKDFLKSANQLISVIRQVEKDIWGEMSAVLGISPVEKFFVGMRFDRNIVMGMSRNDFVNQLSKLVKVSDFHVKNNSRQTGDLSKILGDLYDFHTGHIESKGDSFVNDFASRVLVPISDEAEFHILQNFSIFKDRNYFATKIGWLNSAYLKYQRRIAFGQDPYTTMRALVKDKYAPYVDSYSDGLLESKVKTAKYLKDARYIFEEDLGLHPIESALYHSFEKIGSYLTTLVFTGSSVVRNYFLDNTIVAGRVFNSIVHGRPIDAGSGGMLNFINQYTDKNITSYFQAIRKLPSEASSYLMQTLGVESDILIRTHSSEFLSHFDLDSANNQGGSMFANVLRTSENILFRMINKVSDVTLNSKVNLATKANTAVKYGSHFHYLLKKTNFNLNKMDARDIFYLREVGIGADELRIFKQLESYNIDYKSLYKDIKVYSQASFDNARDINIKGTKFTSVEDALFRTKANYQRLISSIINDVVSLPTHYDHRIGRLTAPRGSIHSLFIRSLTPFWAVTNAQKNNIKKGILLGQGKTPASYIDLGDRKSWEGILDWTADLHVASLSSGAVNSFLSGDDIKLGESQFTGLTESGILGIYGIIFNGFYYGGFTGPKGPTVRLGEDFTGSILGNEYSQKRLLMNSNLKIWYLKYFWNKILFGN